MNIEVSRDEEFALNKIREMKRNGFGTVLCKIHDSLVIECEMNKKERIKKGE